METAQKLRLPSQEKPWMKWYPKDLPGVEVAEKKVYDYFYECNKDRLDEVAIEYFGTTITVQEVLDNVRKTASALSAVGVKENDIVSICMAMQPETIYLFYALSILGATPNNLDPRYSEEGLHDFLEEAHSRFVVTLDIAYPKMQAAAKDTATEKILVISPVESVKPLKKTLYKLAKPDRNQYDEKCMTWQQFIEAGRNKVFKNAEYDPNRPALITHTGGTTGAPKGVMLGDRGINSIALQFTTANPQKDDVFLAVMPPFIAYGFCCGIHMPLCQRCRVAVVPKMEADELPKLLLKYKPNHITVTPLHYQHMLKDKRLKNADLSFLRSTGAGGDSMSVPLEKEVNAFFKAHGMKSPVNKGYGMTEVCASASFCYNENKLGSVGIPMYLTSISTFEPGTDHELSYGEQGELCITGPGMMLGYYNNQKETDHILRLHSDGQYWVHTGDMGHVDEDGFVFVEARIKRMIIRFDGFKVFPSAMENALSMHDEVEVCCVVGVDDIEHGRGKRARAHVVLKNGADPVRVEKELRELCRSNLPEYMYPSEYRFEAALPYTGISKIDYRKLERME